MRTATGSDAGSVQAQWKVHGDSPALPVAAASRRTAAPILHWHAHCSLYARATPSYCHWLRLPLAVPVAVPVQVEAQAASASVCARLPLAVLPVQQLEEIVPLPVPHWQAVPVPVAVH